jgi:uncharacterized membrane protein YgdD (TMEM256/DUF423 family)
MLKQKRKTKMKKLMMIAAAVAMAISANAASYMWSPANGITAFNGTDQFNGTVYLMDASATSQAAFYTAVLGSSDFAAAFATAVGGAVNSATYNGDDWAFANPAKGEWDDVNWGVVVDSATAGTVNYYQVAFDSANNAVLIGDSLAATIPDVGAGSIEFADDGVNKFADSTGFTSGGWYTAAAVPEPTSGLLMLVGLAGLALRRRRA